MILWYSNCFAFVGWFEMYSATRPVHLSSVVDTFEGKTQDVLGEYIPKIDVFVIGCTTLHRHTRLSSDDPVK